MEERDYFEPPALTFEDYRRMYGYATYRRGIVYPAMAVSGECGEFTEKVAKWFRDCPDRWDGYKFNPTDEQRRAGLKELGDILWQVQACAEELGSSLAEVARINMEKLDARRATNTLHGSGDNREETVSGFRTEYLASPERA